MLLVISAAYADIVTCVLNQKMDIENYLEYAEKLIEECMEKRAKNDVIKFERKPIPKPAENRAQMLKVLISYAIIGIFLFCNFIQYLHFDRFLSFTV